MEVRFGQFFTQHFKNFPKADQIKIADFISYVQTHGLNDLPGRNKPSHEVPTDNPNWSEIVAYAQKYKLWHYHIGIPCYVQSVHGGLFRIKRLYRMPNGGVRIVSDNYR